MPHKERWKLVSLTPKGMSINNNIFMIPQEMWVQREKNEANEPLREKAEELAQQLNRKQDKIVSILREIEDLQSQFQPTHKHDHLINWQNSNAQLIVDDLPHFRWIENSRMNPHYRLVKLSDREMKT
jgi:hypothetical protein